MRRTVPHDSRGFTLVELLVGASLSAALMAAVLSTYVYLGRSLARLANQQTLEIEGRRALGYLSQDAQLATDVILKTTAPFPTPPDFSLTLSIPEQSNGANQVTYCYSHDGTPATLPPDYATSIDIPAHTLLRVLSSATPTTATVVDAPQVMLRNIVDEDDGCYVRFFDAGGRPYDNGTPPYTTVTAYAAGIKQVALGFKTQLGGENNGTRTPVYRVTSSQLVLRNRALLP